MAKKCFGPCQAKNKEDQQNMTFNPDCAKCMQIWADFIMEKKIHAISEFKASDFDKI